MPIKKKKKKKKKKIRNQEIEFQLSFTDITMVESSGSYDRVKKLVEEEIGPHEWNINTILTVESPFGLGRMELNFRADKNLYIIDYNPSTVNIYHNPDLSALMRWSQLSGWKIPQPAASLIRSNLNFWRYMWETLIIDSEYLDERFGVRKSLDMRVITKTEMELAEDAEEIQEK